MEIKPVRTKKDYKAALKEIDFLMASGPGLGTPDGDRMDQQGLSPKDLEPMIGQRNRVYEILNRKRPLAMVWRLHTGLGIPAESLIRQPA